MSSVGAAHVEFVLPAAQLAQSLSIVCDVLKVFLRIVGQAQSSLRLDEANLFQRGWSDLWLPQCPVRVRTKDVNAFAEWVMYKH